MLLGFFLVVLDLIDVLRFGGIVLVEKRHQVIVVLLWMWVLLGAIHQLLPDFLECIFHGCLAERGLFQGVIWIFRQASGKIVEELIGIWLLFLLLQFLLLLVLELVLLSRFLLLGSSHYIITKFNNILYHSLKSL